MPALSEMWNGPVISGLHSQQPKQNYNKSHCKTSFYRFNNQGSRQREMPPYSNICVKTRNCDKMLFDKQLSQRENILNRSPVARTHSISNSLSMNNLIDRTSPQSPAHYTSKLNNCVRSTTDNRNAFNIKMALHLTIQGEYSTAVLAPAWMRTSMDKSALKPAATATSTHSGGPTIVSEGSVGPLTALVTGLFNATPKKHVSQKIEPDTNSLCSEQLDLQKVEAFSPSHCNVMISTDKVDEMSEKPIQKPDKVSNNESSHRITNGGSSSDDEIYDDVIACPRDSKTGRGMKRTQKKPQLEKYSSDDYTKIHDKPSKDKKNVRKSKQRSKVTQNAKNPSCNSSVLKNDQPVDNSNCDKPQTKLCESVSKVQRNCKKSKLKHLNREPKYFTQCSDFTNQDSDDAVNPKDADSHGDIRQKLREGYMQSRLYELDKRNEQSGSKDADFIKNCKKYTRKPDSVDKPACVTKMGDVFLNTTSPESPQQKKHAKNDNKNSIAILMSLSDTETDDWSDDSGDSTDPDLSCFLSVDDPFNIASFHVFRILSPKCLSPTVDAWDSDGAKDEMSRRVQTANLTWSATPRSHPGGGEQVIEPRKKTVHFAPPMSLATTHLMLAWRYAYAAARPGPWEQYARDRERFRRRIADSEAVLTPVLGECYRIAARRRLGTFHTL